jgi:hypothetical protein
MNRRRSFSPTARWALAAALLALAALPVLAFAHGGADANAERPQFDSASLTLVGSGGYATERDHRAVRVKVCLRKRYRGRFVRIRCQTDADNDRSVSASISVPGCVRGAWRTTAAGQALNRAGRWSHRAFDRSPVVRCPEARDG